MACWRQSAGLRMECLFFPLTKDPAGSTLGKSSCARHVEVLDFPPFNMEGYYSQMCVPSLLERRFTFLLPFHVPFLKKYHVKAMDFPWRLLSLQTIFSLEVKHCCYRLSSSFERSSGSLRNNRTAPQALSKPLLLKVKKQGEKAGAILSVLIFPPTSPGSRHLT